MTHRRFLLQPLAVVLLLGVLCYKIYACFQVPLVTSDVFRHLGYASHALDHNFGIYMTKAQDFWPEAWTRHWSDQTYIYPPVTLSFFYLFSVFHLGIFWVKATLVAIDIACSYLVYKHISKLAAVFFFCAPISLWYTASEGQFEILQTLFIILNAIAVKRRKWRFAGLWFVLSIQVKQFGVLLLPWMLYKMWEHRQNDNLPFQSLLYKAIQGGVLGFLPFIAFYLKTPLLLLLPLTSGSAGIYNPYAWNLLNSSLFSWNPKWLVLWNALFSGVPVLLLAITAIVAWRQRKFAVSVSTLPLTSFWLITKSLQWGQFWYTIVAPGFLFCLSRKSLIQVLLLLHFMQCLHSAVAILGQPIGAQEPADSIALMQACMFTCDAQRLVIIN